MTKSVSIITLGCFRNNYDSEVLLNSYKENGFTVKEYDSKKVDTLIINTCGFIEDAKKESLSVINDAIELKKSGKIKNLHIVGCLVQRYKNELSKSFPEIDSWQGNIEFSKKTSKRVILENKHLGFLKIAEGCVNRCSYCAIPSIKGPLKSRPWNQVIEEVKTLNKEKVSELNIIGQDITSWGRDLYKDKDLTFLLKKILKASDNIPWIRLFYLHPKHVTDSLINLIAKENRICKYIDLPIQHINDRILKLMNRKVGKKKIVSLIKKIRNKISDVAIRTSLIVGFPTETDAEFKELYDFVKEVKFDRLGVFQYSKEEDTKAFLLKPQIPSSIKNKRFSKLMKLQQKISYKRNQSFVGKKIRVLIDQKDKGFYIGRSQFDGFEVDGNILVKRKNMRVGQFYNLTVSDCTEYDLIAC